MQLCGVLLVAVLVSVEAGCKFGKFRNLKDKAVHPSIPPLQNVTALHKEYCLYKAGSEKNCRSVTYSEKEGCILYNFSHPDEELTDQPETDYFTKGNVFMFPMAVWMFVYAYMIHVY